MKRTLIYLSLVFFAILGLLILAAVRQLVDLFAHGFALDLGVAGAVLLLIFVVLVAYPVVSILFALRQTGRPRIAGGRTHSRYIVTLARLHRRYPVVNLDGLPADAHAFLSELYLRLYESSNALTTTTAETVFFHTAISQSGVMDTLVVRRIQLQLINQIAKLYHPHPGFKVLTALYVDVIDAVLTPSDRHELDLGAQIGPAIVGASVVGAIPGANLVSILIADAVVQGSSNALATLRVGLLARRYFHRMMEGGPFDLATERRAVTQEALEMLSRLVTDASGTLSRNIWNATKDHLRRIPAATYESLKSLMARSVRGLTRRKGAKGKTHPTT